MASSEKGGDTEAIARSNDKIAKSNSTSNKNTSGDK